MIAISDYGCLFSLFSLSPSSMPLFNLLTSENVFSHFSFFFFPSFIPWIIYYDNKISRRCLLLRDAPVNDTTTLTTSQRFKENDYEVVRKDGLVFLREMAAEVKNFMDFKMSAVMVSHSFSTGG